MWNDKKILAVIPARAGSKGIKDKNIVDFAGKPLIAWTIDAAKNSQYIDRIVVSTDGERIAQVAKEHGADVPFVRPDEFATDTAPSEVIIKHCYDWLKAEEQKVYDFIIFLQPTSPLRSTQCIDDSIEYYFKNKKTNEDMLVSVSELSTKVALMMQENDEGYINFCFEIEDGKRQRQILPSYYSPNGMIYFGQAEQMAYDGFYGSRVIKYVIDDASTIDIDTPEDLIKALEQLKIQSSL